MDHFREKQLAQIVDSHDFDAVSDKIAEIFGLHYASESVRRIQDGCRIIRDLFEGRFPGYRRCYAGYHDLRHTLDVTLTTVRLLDGHNLCDQTLPEGLARALVQAALLHDAGYIQEEWDTEGQVPSTRSSTNKEASWLWKPMLESWELIAPTYR